MNEHYTPPKSVDLMDAVRNVESDRFPRTAEGMYRDHILAALSEIGLLADEQTPESIEKGISDAKWLVETGDAAEALSHHNFIDETMLQRYLSEEHPTVSIDFNTKDPVPIRWNKLDGAAGFDSWLGRGHEGSGSVDSAASSKEKIYDFATRDSRIPPIEVTVILTPDGPVSIAMNSHRAAAAIMRSEDIGCEFLKVIDARNQ